MSENESGSLGEIIDVSANLAWMNEVTFSRWLANNLGGITDLLGVNDLELIANEGPTGDFRCDIVAREVGGGRTVIIENQFTKTDHDHLGKLLTYAAHHTAEIVVWISTEVRDEHRAAIDWLNKITGDDIGLFAVQLRVITIDSSRPAPLFEVRASPNRTTKPAPSFTPSPRAQLYQQFFQPLVDELREKYRFTNARVATPQSWVAFGSGHAGFQYLAAFSRGRKLRALVSIDVGNRSANKAAFDVLYAQRREIEQLLGFSLEWDRLPDLQVSRIGISRAESSIEQLASDGPAMRQWLIEHLLALKRAIGPRLPVAATEAGRATDPVESGNEQEEVSHDVA